MAQEKDVEIERLRTTCAALAAKAAVNEDVMAQNETLKKRLAMVEAENV